MPNAKLNNKNDAYDDQEIADLIGNTPSWLLRSGIGLIALFVIMFFILSSYIRYPDKFNSIGMLTSSRPPVEVLSMSEGYLKKMIVHDGDQISSNQELFYIENTVNENDLAALSKWISDYEKIKNVDRYKFLNIPGNLSLGSVQNDYANLSLKFNELKQTLSNNILVEENANLDKEILNIERLKQVQAREKELYFKEIALMKKNHDRNNELFKSDLISETDLENSKASLLSKERQFESMENEIIKNNINIEQLELEKLRLNKDRTNLISNYQFQIAEIIANTKSKIRNWSENYIVKAKIDGEVSLLADVKENIFVEKGQVLAYIISDEASKKYISIKAPVTNIGKLAVGQKVIIKFDAFPYKEFGVIESTVSKIGTIPEITENNNAFYEVITNLPDTLITDFGIQIPFKPGMTANLDIITEDKTILARIFNQFTAALKNR